MFHPPDESLVKISPSRQTNLGIPPTADSIHSTEADYFKVLSGSKKLG